MSGALQRPPQSIPVPGVPGGELIVFAAEPTVLGRNERGEVVTLESCLLFPALLDTLDRATLTAEGRLAFRLMRLAELGLVSFPEQEDP